MNSNIGQKIKVTIDRPIGTKHPEYPELIYECNYGYVEGTLGGDGEEQDAYVLGVSEPILTFCGVVIAEIVRDDDNESKWVVAPIGMKFTESEILDKVNFQEKFFKSRILTDDLK